MPSVANIRESSQPREDDNILAPSEKESRSFSAIDLNKSIQVIMPIFPISERITGSKIEPFSGRLNSVLEEKVPSKIREEHQPTVLFSLTQPSSKARSDLKKCNLQNISINQMVDHLKRNASTIQTYKTGEQVDGIMSATKIFNPNTALKRKQLEQASIMLRVSSRIYQTISATMLSYVTGSKTSSKE